MRQSFPIIRSLRGSLIPRWVCCIVLLCAVLPVEAQSKKDLENERAQIEQQIRKLNAELTSVKKNTRMSNAQLAVLGKKIKERTRLINNLNSQMRLIDSQIAGLQDSIGVLQLRIDSLKREYGKIIRVLYAERGNLDRNTMLLDIKEYNRSFLRRHYFEEYSKYRRMQAAAIRQREDELRTVNITLQHQKNEKNNLLEQEQRQKSALAAEQNQQKNNLKKNQKREKELQNQISKKEQQKRKLQQQIQKLINEEIAKARKAEELAKKSKSNANQPAKSAGSNDKSASASGSNAFVSQKGKLSWPLYFKKVTREYGRYTHESGGVNMNNGIDLSVASGTVVSVIFEGKVSKVFVCPDGSKGVIVRHGEYMSVYAGLGNVIVKEGASVTTKQKIGTTQTDASGVVDFSFQLWKGTQSQNPRSWLK
ncbi:MAG: peptidoglycan DD-metalloendopeptidase family protein [Bacteroidales bacterium]|nr:peptidoglycan DD-metalloendopeptidase family protein [Candidatus Colimorpha onthohippi]